VSDQSSLVDYSWCILLRDGDCCHCGHTWAAVAQSTRWPRCHDPPCVQPDSRLACAGYFAFLDPVDLAQVDASHGLWPKELGQYVGPSAPRDGIPFVRGDRVVLGLWCFQSALRAHLGLAVIANALLPFDWYRKNPNHRNADLLMPEPSDAPCCLASGKQSLIAQPRIFSSPLVP